MKTITEWYDHGGILCVSLDKYASACKAFFDTESSKRGATSNKTATKKSSVHIKNNAFLRRALFQPGPDIVVLDEVHSMLKSNNTNIYKALCGMGTRLRLGLTGSPIQNNLYEYFRMANYVRPGCLGTEANFTKKFHDPIMDGMAADCTPLEADTQEQVSKELHGILAKFVHRRDADVLSKELPFLQETIIHVRQSRVQGKACQRIITIFFFCPIFNVRLLIHLSDHLSLLCSEYLSSIENSASTNAKLTTKVFSSNIMLYAQYRTILHA